MCEKKSEDSIDYAQNDIEIEEEYEETQNLEIEEDEIELNPAWSSLNLIGLPLITLNEDSLEEEEEEEEEDEEDEVIIHQHGNNNKRKICQTLGLKKSFGEPSKRAKLE